MSPKDRMAAMMAGLTPRLGQQEANAHFGGGGNPFPPQPRLSEQDANNHFGDGNSFNMQPPGFGQPNPAFNMQPQGFGQPTNPAFNMQNPSEDERQQRLRQMMGGTMR